MIVKTNGSFAALVEIIDNVRGQCGQSECTERWRWSLGYRYLAASLPVSRREGKDFQGKRQMKDFQFAVLLLAAVSVYFNSLLPLGRYIDMDPSTTELVISQTQFIRFGQFLLG